MKPDKDPFGGEETTGNSELQLRYLREHGVRDKDSENSGKTRDQPFRKTVPNLRSKDHESGFNSIPDIDLHGLSLLDALERVDEAMDSLARMGGGSVLVIHGGGSPDYGPIARELHRKLRGPWSARTLHFDTPAANPGCTRIAVKKIDT